MQTTLTKNEIQAHNDFLSKAYADFSDSIFRYCYFRTSDPNVARELMQEAYTRSMQYLMKGNEILDAKPFLFKTAKHLLIDWYKSRKVKISIDAIDGAEFQAFVISDKTVEDASEVHRMVHALEDFNPLYREALSLRYVSGLKVREIAEMSGEKESVISMRIHRGLKKLRVIFT
jgi:RNA polymerase sigma-70 factor, ECF subfamily